MKINKLTLFQLFFLKGTRNEGWFDPWLLLSAFKKKVIAMGVHYIKGEVCGMDMGENGVRSVQVNEVTCKEPSLGVAGGSQYSNLSHLS